MIVAVYPKIAILSIKKFSLIKSGKNDEVQRFFQDLGHGGGGGIICNLVEGTALSTHTVLDNVVGSSIQSITLTIHKA